MSKEKNIETLQEKKSYAGTNKLMLIFRLIAACYILYLAWTLVESYVEGDGMPLVGLIIFVSIFAIISLTIIYITVKALIRGEYAGGKADSGEEAVNEENDIEEKEEDKGIARNAMLLSERLSKYNEEDGDGN